MAEQRSTPTALRPDGPERRTCPSSGTRVERRAEGGVPRIVAHPAVFDQWTIIYRGKYFEWREVVRRGAFANALKEKQDVRSLFNHDSNIVLGRIGSGTLTLSEDATGLLSETTPPDTQTVRDLVIVPIERGDISGGSFAFTVRRAAETKVTIANGVTVIDNGGERITIREEDGREIEERELLDLDLYEVSPAVTFPQYEQTDVALRTLAERRELIIQGRGGRRPLLSRAEKRLRLLDAAILSSP